jgi:pyridoxamine 5'-phosphate oxidase
VGAWASDQSAPLESREALIQRVRDFEAKFEGMEVPRPPHWTGFTLSPETVEFWTQREYRLHDRFVYRLEEGRWTRQRLNP